MQRRERVAAAWLGGLLACAVAACGNGAGGEEPARTAAEGAEPAPLDPRLAGALPPGATREAAEEGRRQFAACATCHGFSGAGTELGPSLTDREWIHGSGELAEIEQLVRAGVAEPKEYPVPMPPLGAASLTDEQLRAVSVYVYALSHAAP